MGTERANVADISLGASAKTPRGIALPIQPRPQGNRISKLETSTHYRPKPRSISVTGILYGIIRIWQRSTVAAVLAHGC